ncbi:MAG: hypothetical protein IT260_11260, partial [Saprospiraceae bacterium]|nr:hypothetical protein [Saprospiraceae bacterium]
MKNLLPLFAALLFSLSGWAQKTEKCPSDQLYQELIAKDTALRHRAEELEEKTKVWAKKGPGDASGHAVITIPVVVHVIHNGEAVGVGSNISEEQILSQIEVLNADFRHVNPDSLDISHPFWDKTVDCRIEFCLAQYDPYGIPTTGITRQKGEQDAWDITALDATLKPATIWDRKKYLNIWSVNFNDDETLGYALRPGVATESTDGMVLRHQALGKTGTAGTQGFSVNNLGRTGTHEVGHWLNLIHIWGDNICGNDEVADTEPALLPNQGCPPFPHNANNNCGSGQYGEMYMNYMDYVEDHCMNMFTKGQGDRMQAALEVARPGMLKSKACSSEPPCEAPIGLAMSQITTTTAVATWKVAPYSIQYIFQYRAVSDSVWTRQTTFYNSKALGNLEAGKTYEARLASLCVDGETDFGETVTFTTTNVTCNPPAWIIENPNSVGEIRWQSVASQYFVEIRPKGATRWALFSASSNQFNLLSILAPGTYQIRVQSVCTDKVSNYSSVFEYTANFLCPGISNL